MKLDLPTSLDIADLEAVLAPFGESSMPPRAAYIDDQVLTWERHVLFEGGWVCAGRSALVPNPGDQHATQVGRTGILLVRHDEGSLTVLANICRHRGHELLPCDATVNRSVIQCPYHAWSYELDGRLRLAPRFEQVPADLGLGQIRHVEWGGWVFVNISGDAPPFEDHLGELATLTANWDLPSLVPAVTHRYDLAANWKLVQENYHECYHCPLIHPQLCRVSPPTSSDNQPGGFGGWVGGSMDLDPSATTMSMDGRSGGQLLPGLTATERRQVLYVGLFPNLLVSLHPDYVLTHRIEPAAPDRSIVECQWLFPADLVAGAGFDPSYAVEFWDITNRQDWSAVESVQRNLASPHFRPGLLAPMEDAVYQFVTMVARAYCGAPLGVAR